MATTTSPHRDRDRLSRRTSPWPGLLASLAAAGVAVGVHLLLPAVSPLLVSILLGVLAASSARLPASLAPGLRISARQLLRIGIVLLGLQLSLSSVLDLGWPVVAAVVTVVVVGITGTVGLGRLLGVPRGQRLLVACGFSICGAAAIAAVESTVDADEEDVASSIALVVLFGTGMIAVVPLLLGTLPLTPTQQGFVAGASIHEVAQVVATGGILGGGALGVAVVVKLARVLMLAPVVVGLGVWQRRSGAAHATRPPLVPLFVLGFLAASALTTVTELPAALLAVSGAVQAVALSAAMFALGTAVRRDPLSRLGPAALLLGTGSTVLVLGVALAWVGLVA